MDVPGCTGWIWSSRPGAGARAGGSRMWSWSWKPFSDGVGNVVNFSHAFFGLMMHLRSQHRRSSSSSSNSNPYYDPNSSTISCSAFPSAVKWNAATCNGSRASGNNLRKQSLQFTVLMSITKTNSSWHTAPSQLQPIYHSQFRSFMYPQQLCAISYHIDFVALAFVKGKYFIFLHSI